METGLTAGAAAGSSSARKDETSFDVAEPPPPLEPHEHQESMTPAMKMLMMKNLCSTMPS
jgi:hypothetical protein